MPFDPGNPPPLSAVEQYKSKLSDLANLGTRLTSMTTYYVSIISAFLGVLAFKDRKLVDIEPFVIVVVCAGGMWISVLWYFNIQFFRSLFRAKLMMLEKMEESFPFQTFQDEFKELKKRKGSSWLSVEKYVPAVFFIAFAIILFARFFQMVKR